MNVFILQKRMLLLLLVQVCKTPEKSWNFVESPGKVPLMQKVLEKVKKSPGKSWNLNPFFWWGTM